MVLKTVLKGLGAAFVGANTYVAGNYILESPTPLNTKVEFQPRIEVGGVNILPVVAAYFKSLPQSIRLDLLARATAPKNKETEDFMDIFGTDPYEVAEVVPGKVWRVTYQVVNQAAFSADEKAGMKLMGLNFDDPASADAILEAAALVGPATVKQAKIDLQRNAEVNALVDAQGKTKETVAALGPFPSNMIVVKLNSGGVLLYNPNRIREDCDVAALLKTHGPVKYIVSGSSAHTNQIPSVVNSFPDAKVVSSEGAWLKLQHVAGFPKKSPDCMYTNKQELDQLNRELESEGVKFYHIEGDVAGSALVGIAHQTALEADLIYSLYSGGMLTLPPGDEQEKNYFMRLFKLRLGSSPNSPNNALPPYRFWMMDPSSPISSLGITPIPKDGSSTVTMAASLRTLLQEDIQQAVGAHFNHLSGEEFKKSIDMNWNWLDGKPLI